MEKRASHILFPFLELGFHLLLMPQDGIKRIWKSAFYNFQATPPSTPFFCLPTCQPVPLPLPLPAVQPAFPALAICFLPLVFLPFLFTVATISFYHFHFCLMHLGLLYFLKLPSIFGQQLDNR
jgi:hypothetical protein